MERCELVCKTVEVRECGKVLDNTADDKEEVWVEDEDTCVELEKTQCTVQEREGEADWEQVSDSQTQEVLQSLPEEAVEDESTRTELQATNENENYGEEDTLPDVEVTTDETAIHFGRIAQ